MAEDSGAVFQFTVSRPEPALVFVANFTEPDCRAVTRAFNCPVSALIRT